MRVMVMVAVKNDAGASSRRGGPVPPVRPGLPVSVSRPAPTLQIALDMGKYVNSFSWRGDPPR